MIPLIVAATEEEILPSITVLKKKQIPFLITGVGMTATAYQLGKYLVQSRPDYILNVGIAGAFSLDIPLGTIVNITEDSFAELGAEDDKDFISIEKLGFGTNTFHCSYQPTATNQLPKGNAITVNTVHGNALSISRVLKRFPNVNLESMEGAAVFFAAAAENIPCLQIRAISNYVQKRDRTSWEVPLAIKQLNTWLQNFIGQP